MSGARQSFQCRVAGIGAFGPLFRNWQELSDLLNGGVVNEAAANAQPRPDIIPANERRRAPLIVRLAVETSWQASQQAQVAPDSMSSVFVSGFGDTDLGDYCCRELATDTPRLSPTKFHNSVHNAAAGYWTISTGCRHAASTIAGFHNSVGLALLEALTQCVVEQEPVLVTFVDIPVALTQREMLANDEPFSLAMVLLPEEHASEGPSLVASVVPAVTGSNSSSDSPFDPHEVSNPTSGTTSNAASHPTSDLVLEQRPSLLPDSLDSLRSKNPAAKILTLAKQLAARSSSGSGSDSTNDEAEPVLMALSATTSLELTLE